MLNVVMAMTVCNATLAVASVCEVQRLGAGHSIVVPESGAKYVLLPVQESSEESRIDVVNNNNCRETINVRLASDRIDYYVPYEYESGDKLYVHTPYKEDGESLHSRDANLYGTWTSHIETSDTFNVPDEKYRPLYHFSPKYGWMNDPNGMFYKDGEYHLYYQHNPYAAVWGNMSWGHAVSRDLVHWEHRPVALKSDAWGAIFSGSSVVDKDNAAGFGKDAIVAFYTSAGARQMQSIAYSTDNGATFKKYADNPVVTSDATDFRDPKVIWHEPSKKWIMVLAVGQEMQFRSSSDLKHWTYESSFGEGEGCHDGVWECPDLVELPIEGTNETRWMLVCNINPGGPFGGSATQYFIGSFDGHKFVNESPGKTKWMDYGKDHYATVSWSNAPEGRCVAIAWMSNWQYANVLPTTYFTSSNSVARDLSLYRYAGDVYVKSAPIKELEKCFKEQLSKSRLSVNKKPVSVVLPKSAGEAYAIDLTLEKGSADKISMELINAEGEKVVLSCDGTKFSVDRTKSGNVDFSGDFPAVTVAPINSDASAVALRIFVDRGSVEVFGNGGRFVLTNIVFPSSPYNKLTFTSEGGKSKINNLKVYKIEL